LYLLLPPMFRFSFTQGDVTDLSVLNKICWTISIVCIIAGTVLSFAMIWATLDNEFVWKAWASMGVLFFASSATLVVSKVLGRNKGGVV
jgi:hypothetical protein